MLTGHPWNWILQGTVFEGSVQSFLSIDGTLLAFFLNGLTLVVLTKKRDYPPPIWYESWFGQKKFFDATCWISVGINSLVYHHFFYTIKHTPTKLLTSSLSMIPFCGHSTNLGQIKGFGIAFWQALFFAKIYSNSLPK